MTNFIELAKERYKQGNNVDFGLTFNEFICQCYIKLKPCSYGMRIERKIMDEVGGKSNSPSLNLGDISFLGKNAEIKVSFLSQTNTYSLTHIRMWQEFDMYLFCLIDCDNNFTPEFYLIDKFIMGDVKMGPMNGTKLSNTKNKNIELRVTIKKGGDVYSMFKRFNKLNGTTLLDLKSFISI
jgi:hypothetical protein